MCSPEHAGMCWADSTRLADGRNTLCKGAKLYKIKQKEILGYLQKTAKLWTYYPGSVHPPLGKANYILVTRLPGYLKENFSNKEWVNLKACQEYHEPLQTAPEEVKPRGSLVFLLDNEASPLLWVSTSQHLLPEKRGKARLVVRGVWPSRTWQ